MQNIKKHVALVILDGWGLNKNPKVSAIEAASTPYVDSLMEHCPSSTLTTFGEEVGLPPSQMGNSEVGHINIGAGRVVYQELVRINKAIREKELLSNPVFTDSIKYAKHHTKRVHLLGLVSDGGVHSHIDHLLGLCELLKDEPILEIYIHAFLDGRDTDPRGGHEYLKKVQEAIRGTNIKIATVVGRYYAMDRDKRWERVKIAYDLLVKGEGKPSTDILGSILTEYQNGNTDEFMPPIINATIAAKTPIIQDDDVVIFYNFRTDRPRLITEVLTQTDMPEFDMYKKSLYYVTFANYDHTFKGIHIVFEKDNLTHTMGQVVSEAGLTQVRIAETEKYPHVTFFFNGGRENEFIGESRIMVASPRIATYDLQPEMSAVEITDKLIEKVNAEKPNFICLNYANTDMVGHTGVFAAAVKATETVDNCLSRLIPVLLSKNYYIFIIADHGNSDIMVNPDGSPNTAHTTNPVPLILVGNDVNKETYTLHNGKLGDLAPTMLMMMGLKPAEQMTGDVIARKT